MPESCYPPQTEGGEACLNTATSVHGKIEDFSGPEQLPTNANPWSGVVCGLG